MAACANKVIGGVSDGLTKVEASRHLQVGALAKVIDRGNAELVAGLFGEVADGRLGGDDGFRDIASLPRLGAHLPPLDKVALDGDRAVAVRGTPLEGDGGVSLVLHHGVDWGIWRMLSGSCSQGENVF